MNLWRRLWLFIAKKRRSTSATPAREPADELRELKPGIKKPGYTKTPNPMSYNTWKAVKGYTTNNHQTASQAKTTPSLQSFTLFSQLPPELRIDIWKYMFVPRTITLKCHSGRPALNPRSVEGLLLVNYEASRLFKESYTRCFHTYGLPAIYMNFDLDTLSLSGVFAMRDLKRLLRQYTFTMSRIKYLEVYPDHRWPNFYWDGYHIESIMSSLELLTMKLPTAHSWRYANPSLEDNERSLRLIVEAMGKDDSESEVSTTPRLAVVFSPKLHSIYHKQLERTYGFTGPGLHLVQPAESTWDHIEATMCEEWRKTWSGRKDCRKNGWCVYEFAQG